jgi:hypothetical protein
MMCTATGIGSTSTLQVVVAKSQQRDHHCFCNAERALAAGSVTTLTATTCMSEADQEEQDGLSVGDPLSSSRAPDLRFFADGTSCEPRLRQQGKNPALESGSRQSDSHLTAETCESPDAQSTAQQQRRLPQLTLEICDTAAQSRHPHAEFRAGRSLEDHFIVQRQLGRGAFSTVFQ